MKIEGAYHIPAARERIWATLLNPECLARALPGCDGVTSESEGEYRVVIKVGVASVKAAFAGVVRLADLDPPSGYSMEVEGSSKAGTAHAEAQIRLNEVDGGTKVSYGADVNLTGMVASLGQGVLGPMAKMMLDHFFSKIAMQLRESGEGAVTDRK